jgi:hypothetical protein
VNCNVARMYWRWWQKSLGDADWGMKEVARRQAVESGGARSEELLQD